MMIISLKILPDKLIISISLIKRRPKIIFQALIFIMEILILIVKQTRTNLRVEIKTLVIKQHQLEVVSLTLLKNQKTRTRT